jgi:serine/threonine-protein kinase RsbW
MGSINLAINSDIDNVSGLAQAVRALCSAYLTSDELDAIELSLVEAINNIIKHGYHGQRDRPVQVLVDQRPDQIVLEVIDEAPPMPQGLLENPSSAPFAYDDPGVSEMPESGIGLALIRMNMDEVQYTSAGGQNHLRMVKRIGKASR